MASPDFDGELFEKRLQALKDSQESIQSLSSWCLERRSHHKKIVATWLQVLKKVKVEHRLTLFYLANDVIQYSKRKNFEFVESWGTTLQRATTMVRDEKVKHRILRIFKIWDQRQVYDEEFLADLSGLISAAPKKKAEPPPITIPEEFQASILISTMRSCSALEQATDSRLRDLRDNNVDVDNAEELCASLKDRSRVEDAEKEVEVAVKNIEDYVHALEAEIRERTTVLDLLEQADQFYETQRGEVKIVTNAYRNFGSRVKNLKKKLDELLPTLTSPIPSPDINAPSPSPDSDIELPGDDHIQSTIIDIAPPSMYGSYGQDYEPLPVPAPELTQGNSSADFTSNFSSFMGGNVDFDMRNIFSERSATPIGSQAYNIGSEAMPIEVINMRPDKDFGSTNFLKSVLPAPDDAPNSSGIPGLGLDVPEPRTESPQRPDYSHLPQNQLNSLPATPRSLNNHGMGHSTPIGRNLGSKLHTASSYSNQSSQVVSMPFDGPNSVNPLPPPPLPPPIFLDEENCYNKLPPKFPTWTSTSEGAKEQRPKWNDEGKSMNANWSETDDKGWDATSDSSWSNGIRTNKVLLETPESPPMYEKSSFRDPVQYNDPQSQEPILSSATDVDHRVIPAPMPADVHPPHRLIKTADVDHRNLISLTGSPANNISNTNDAAPVTNNRLWSNADQDYRRQPQPGDIVESVDMEMSDEESDGIKQKNRVLVDLRSQDRDMRNPQPSIPPRHLDMDMRMIPLPTNTQMTRPPLPPSQYHRPQEFNPNYRQNHPPPGFMLNQPDFQPDFYDFPENQHQRLHPEENFHEDPPIRGRFPPSDHLQQSPMFHREDRGSRGRFSLNNRRDRFSEDRRNASNNRRLRQDQQSEALLQPPDTVVILDDSGMPIMPDVIDEIILPEDNCENTADKMSSPPDIEANTQGERPESHGDAEEIASEDRSQEGSADEPPRNLSEHLEALMNSGKTTGVNELKRQSENGNFDEIEEEPGSPSKKRQFFPNGPQTGATELHPAVIYEYDGQHASPNFRPRLPTPVAGATGSPFAPWRGTGHPPRGRGGFRGSPRGPWAERGRGGPHASNFMPRGMKRGSPFRGSGFRGRGRGTSNW